MQRTLTLTHQLPSRRSRGRGKLATVPAPICHVWQDPEASGGIRGQRDIPGTMAPWDYHSEVGDPIPWDRE